MKFETADQTYAFFEEARVVLATLEDKIENFNKASQRFENAQNEFSNIEKNIENIGKRIAEKIHVTTIQEHLINSVKVLKNADDEIIEITRLIQQRRKDERSNLIIILVSSCVATLFTCGIFIAFEAANKPLFNLIYQFVH
ncbi:septation ring formation regulator EzrA [Sulfurospirillum oryzae]|uniref:septation ring formation regulator EzrA n=1 Tax=Sulfurospirillum oryzae TaxID=2976535 RepID=UPI0021E74D47|nr:septation ring formation regulator EzrA [Sulfurospirillum oryzae]